MVFAQGYILRCDIYTCKEFVGGLRTLLHLASIIRSQQIFIERSGDLRTLIVFFPVGLFAFSHCLCFGIISPLNLEVQTVQNWSTCRSKISPRDFGSSPDLPCMLNNMPPSKARERLAYRYVATLRYRTFVFRSRSSVMPDIQIPPRARADLAARLPSMQPRRHPTSLPPCAVWPRYRP